MRGVVVYVRVLGPIAAGIGEHDLTALRSQVSAGVLAHLVAADGRWLTPEAVIDAVWDEAPSTARNAVQVAVSRLRKQYGADLVLSSKFGYAIDPALVRSDLDTAAACVAAARESLADGRPDEAARHAASAIETFVGEPFQGLASHAADAARHRAYDLLNSARELSARALLASAKPDLAAAAIEPLCAADPLDERAQVIRMEAMAAAGRLGAALASYHELRAELADQLGVDPSPATQAAFESLLRATPPVPATGRPIADQRTLGLAPSRATAYQTRAVQHSLPTAGTTVLTGASGTGKTQIAAGAFAESTRRLRIWVSGGSRAAIVSAYADAAEEVKRVDTSRPAKERAQRFLGWLASTSEPWLLVLDDVVDPADLRGWWPPESRHGLVIVTTQRRVAELFGDGRAVFDVGHYTPEESLAYLRARLGAGPGEAPDQLVGLAEDLGHHPLALGLATAVIIDAASTVGEYRDLLATSPLSTSLPDDIRADGYAGSLETAWTIAVERADRQTDGVAHRLLDILSVLDPAGAPEALLDTSTIQDHLYGRVDDPPQVRSQARHRARAVLRTLHQASLTDHDPSLEPRAIRTHALNGRLSRERAEPAGVITALRLAALALVEAWPGLPASALAESLRGNAAVVEALDAQLDDAALWRADADRLPTLIVVHARSLVDAEQFGAAIPYLREQRARCAEHFGEVHLETIGLDNEIARVRSLSGGATDARSDLAARLAQLTRALGEDHPGTLLTATTLASIGIEIGSPSVAIDELEALVPRLEMILGSDDERTLAALEALANAYGEAGDGPAATRVYADVIERWREKVGDDHRRTVILRADHAYWLGHIGEAATSMAELERLLTQMERVLGPRDPNTLRARNNRAYLMTDNAAAYEEFTRLLAVRMEVLGPDHSDTLATRGNLANRRGMMGDAAGAARDFAAVIADQERAIGEENRFTLLCKGYLARWLIEAGDLDGGVALGERTMADLTRVLGADHPYSLRIAGYLPRTGGDGSAAHPSGGSDEAAP